MTSSKESDKKKTDDNLKGTWVLVSAVVDGNKATEMLIKKENHRRTFARNKLTIKRDDLSTPIRATFEVNTTKKPKTIDIVPNEGPDRGKTVLGIYEVKGGILRICVVDPGNERPNGFSSKAGSGQILTVFKRGNKKNDN